MIIFTKIEQEFHLYKDVHAQRNFVNYNNVLYTLGRTVLVQLLVHRVAGFRLVKFITGQWIANEKKQERGGTCMSWAGRWVVELV